ncbi:MAG: hypothetical protein Q8P42_04685 [Gallionella sp.]|nr:hypothetical protein [Gallionella sp.]
MDIRHLIWTNAAVLMLCINASAMEDITVGPMEDVTVGSMEGGRNVSRLPALQGQFATIIQRGAKLLQEKRFREAVATYTQAINANPNSDYVWAARGFALANIGPANYGQAWQDLSKAIELNPRNDSAYLGRVAISKANHQDYSSDLKMAAQLGNRRAQQMLQYASAGGNTPQTMNAGQNASTESSAYQATNPNQRGLSRQQINWGCVIAGENIKCPGHGSEYRHTFEPPQFGQVWEMYVPGTVYTTENTVDGTRWLHTSIGANLPNNALQINQNGTYWWKIRGSKVMEGRWIQEDEHALILKNGYRGVDWRASIEKFGAEEAGRLLLSNDWDRLAGRLATGESIKPVRQAGKSNAN